MTAFVVGDIVCVHAGKGRRRMYPWVGEVCGVIMDKYDLETRAYTVKQLGIRQISSFACRPKELRETVMTFEGPQCVECRVPY